MSHKQVRWLLEELPELVGKGVLPAETAERLRQYYGESAGGARGRNRALVAFSILGAALVGSGIILLLAHNWDDLSRAVRTVLSFAPLVCAQAIAAWVLWKRRDSTAWREGAGIALTLAIGATISLIAQTYNISGDFGAFMLTWTLLALPVIYLLDASAAAMLYLVGITAWTADAQFTSGHPLWFWLLVALVLPYLWRVARRNRFDPRAALICWALAVCLGFGTGFCAADMLSNWWTVIYAGVLAAMYLVGEQWFSEAAHWRQRPFQTIGALGGFALTLMLSCRWPWHETIAYGRHDYPLAELPVAIAWLAVAISLWIESLARRRLAGSLFGALPVVAAIAYWLAANNDTGELLAALLFDAFLFVLGVGTLWRGLREDHLGVVNSGMLMLSALIILRFFDSDLSFVVRGLAFIVVGIGFLTTNLVLIRRKGAVA
ncbi:MAG TPA: DUF2157 domain-containing protein [Verrucomicrobiae bacterium]|nr:DUF2157 domain-containing protein [Verrucomicrobiae bacterium]